ncbi:hypothetical protein GPK34_01335 [Secundilactobacillus kimchicus]|uniref:Ig-like domain-containing protein n=1 Tax=Secundilactobacillus kimchicus TaxID=528209 RepID=UPI001C037CD3|nr:hypothetical protein [Secundilactobacillus kimchicus]
MDSVKFDQATVSVAVGKTVKLTATVTPNNATNKNVVLSSNDEATAKVSSDGTVTGVKAGTATITGTADGKTATSVVTVTAAE